MRKSVYDFQVFESKGTSVHESFMGYDPADRIFFIDLTNVVWETEQHVRDHFARIGVLMKKWAGGGPQDMIIGYIGFKFDMVKLGPVYRDLVIKAGKEYFKNLARWGIEDPLLRSTQRAFAIKTHRASHIYATREQAIEVILGLRAGTIELEA